MTRTAQALAAVEAGMSITEAAKKFGVARASIYRLRAYREGRTQCPKCGSVIKKHGC